MKKLSLIDRMMNTGGAKGPLSNASLALLFVVLVLLPVTVQSADRLTVKDSTGTTKFLVNDAGQVGIGTVTPQYDLDIIAPNNGLIRMGSAETDSSLKVARLVVRHYLNAQAPLYLLGAASTATNNFVAFGGGSTTGNAATQIDFFTAPNTSTLMGTSRVTITGAGNVGIGTANPVYPLQMASGAFVTSGGTWMNASSRDYKENIEELTAAEAADAVAKLDPVKYNYKVDREDRHVGFIAEDVPDLVAAKDRKGLSPMDVVAVLTKVVQEQQKTIAALSKEVADLKEAVSSK